MIPEFSELKFLNYLVNESSFSTIHKEDISIEKVKETINQQSFSVDFEVFENEDDNRFFFIELNINRSKRKKQAGYSFNISIVANFELTNRSEIPEKKELQYILFSALPMVISLARSEISHITSSGIYGKYILPSINLPDLVKKWMNKQE